MDRSSETTSGAVYVFGPYRLDAGRLGLERNGAPVPVTPRVLSALLFLVEHAGRTVSKQEMLAALWPGRVAEEANLSQAVSAVRKVLASGGDGDLILTVPGRGYRFTGEVMLERVVAPTRLPPPARRTRRRRWLAAAGAGAAFAAAGVAWLTLRPAGPASPATGIGVVLADGRNFTTPCCAA